MFLGLEFGTYFGTREGYLVGVLLETLVGLMIGTEEESLVGLSPGLTLVSPLEYPNTGVVLGSLFVTLARIILVMSLAFDIA